MRAGGRRKPAPFVIFVIIVIFVTFVVFSVISVFRARLRPPPRRLWEIGEGLTPRSAGLGETGAFEKRNLRFAKESLSRVRRKSKFAMPIESVGFLLILQERKQ